jgi:multidrug efflux pump subunit AcrB
MRPAFDPAGFSVRNWQFMGVVLALLVALGAVTWRAIPRSEDPPFDAPNFGIVAVLPGAAPGDIETRVMDPIEDRLRKLESVDKLEGNAADGVAYVQIEYALDGTAPDDRYAELVREVGILRTELPPEITRLEILRLRPDTVTALLFALVAPTSSVADLRTTSDALQDAIEAVPGVADVAVNALPDERIDVAVDAEAMAAAGVQVDAIFNAIGPNDARIPGGHVDVGERRLSVATESDWTSEADLRDVVLTRTDAVPLRLGDVATVERRSADADHLARLDGRRAVWLAVTYEAGANVFDTRDAALAAARSVALPDGQTLALTFDQSANVTHRMSGFTRDFALAIGLVLLTLLPLGWRASGVVMVAIPLSLAMGLTGLFWLGYTINQLSIVGFVIALGLLVDDAIVVVENVARHIRTGKTPFEAAIAGTREITYAVLGCTATLLFAFLPLLALPGTSGLFIRSLPLTVVVTILASLALSLTVVPLLASRFLRPEPAHGNRVFRLLEAAIERTFRPILARAMHRPWLTLGAAAAVFAASLALVPSVGFSLFPKAGIPMFRVTVDAGEGASLATTDAFVRRVEGELAHRPHVVHTLANVGRGNPRVYYNVAQENARPGYGEVLVLLDRYEPDETPAFLDGLRADFSSWPGARIAVREFEQGPPVDAPVAIRLAGDDLTALGQGSRAIAAALREVDGLTRVDDPLAVRRTDLSVALDRAAAGERGVSPVEVARIVRFGLAGLEIASLRDPDGDEVPVVAHLARHGEPSIGDLSRLHVAKNTGGSVPLGEVATVGLVSGPPRIHHRSGGRVATVTADVRTGFNTDALSAEAVSRVARVALPLGVRWEVAGEAESRAKSFGGMGSAALVAAFGVLAVLVLEFRTFRSTLVVASVVPLGMAGGIAALWLTGNTLSFTASIGFVALMGIEVKNSILLVDFANQLRMNGMPLEAAIARAGETRFVPILLTTATALGGLVPLALENSALYSPLAIVLIGGLISSTLLARVVTPVVYALVAPPIPADDVEAPALDASMATA